MTTSLRPASPRIPRSARFREVIPASDTRFPLSYAAGVLADPADFCRANASEHGHDLALLINLNQNDALTVGIHSPAREAVIPCNHVLGPGLDWHPIGPGVLGCVRLDSEPLFQARRLLDRVQRGRPPSPEVFPGPSQSGRS